MEESRKSYCTLYIVRHGETDWNINRIIQGHYHDTTLNANGETQAKELAKELKDIHFDKAFSSDLKRAQRTAEIIALERELAIETTKVLRERKFGRFEGKPGENLKLVDQLYDALKEEEKFFYKPFPEMESDEEVIGRFITFIRETSVAYPGKTILVVTHGGLMRVLLIHLGFLKREQLQKGSITNTAYIKLLSDGVDFFIKEAKGVTCDNKLSLK